MSLDRTRIEPQLARAKDELASWVKQLASEGVDSKAYKSNPKWRNLNAKVRQISRRLVAVTTIEEVNAACEARKSAGDEPAEEEAPAPKASKPKKAKA